jgi:beta-glucosidase
MQCKPGKFQGFFLGPQSKNITDFLSYQPSVVKSEGPAYNNANAGKLNFIQIDKFPVCMQVSRRGAFMAQAILNFPRDFMWGTATASHQVEGNNINNNWYAWEQSGHIIDRQKCGLACDWWGGRWREDFDRAAESGQNAHRLSIEWSRIQPNENRWDEDALDYYRQMVRGLLERGLTPMVTLHHFTEPLWISELGGWQNEEILTHFQTYTQKVVEALQEYVTWWCTINEPNVYASLAYLTGEFPPGKSNLSAVYKVITNLIMGHALAYDFIHKILPEAKVGLAHQYRSFQPTKSISPLDRWVAGLTSRAFNNAVPDTLKDGKLRFLGIRKRIPGAKGSQDFFGVNYYTEENISFSLQAAKQMFAKRSFPADADLSPTGFIANQPEGFFQALRWAKSYKLPIIVTENGTEDPDDKFRPRYLSEHIHQLWHAVNFNWKILGYFHWSLTDNFEWERGWTQRFGLWELDTNTQERFKRSSADLFEAICKENALSSEMVARYAPEVFEKLFPN